MLGSVVGCGDVSCGGALMASCHGLGALGVHQRRTEHEAPQNTCYMCISVTACCYGGLIGWEVSSVDVCVAIGMHAGGRDCVLEHFFLANPGPPCARCAKIVVPAIKLSFFPTGPARFLTLPEEGHLGTGGSGGPSKFECTRQILLTLHLHS